MVTITKRASNPEDGAILNVQLYSGGFPSSGTATYYPNGPQGNRVAGTNFTGSLPNTSSASVTNSIQRFQGITIPQGATINSAILTIWARNAVGQTDFKLGMKAISKLQMSTAFLTSLPNITTGMLSQYMFPHRTDFVKKTATPSLDASVTKTITGSNYSGGNSTWFGQQAPAEWDVQELVQNLVNNFDYSNDDMIFQIGPKVGLTGTDFENSFYTHQNFSNTAIPPLTKYTTTSQGTSIRSPKLVINFSAPVSPETTILADALLIAQGATTTILADALLQGQGAVSGRCGDEIFW